MEESSKQGMNRRDFLKGAFVAGAAAASSAALVATQPGFASSVAPIEGGAGSARPWEGKAPEIPASAISETIDTDICVVGAGVAGMNATAGASGEGAKVVLLEKTGSFTFRGQDNGGIGSKLQEAEGVVIDRAEVLRCESEWDHDKFNQNLFKVWLYRSGEVFNEIIDLVADAGYTTGFAAGVVPGRDKLAQYYRMYKTNHGFGQTPEVFDSNGNRVAVQGVYLGILETYALEHGAEIRYNTPAQQLITDSSGAVKGVIALKEDGTYLQVNTSKGVIMASGDISGNKEMCREWCPMTLHNLGNGAGQVDAYTPMGANTGDGLQMGMWAGAVHQIAPAAPMVHGFGRQMPFGAQYIGWLQVNNKGKRYHNEEPNEVSNSNGMMLQPQSQGFWMFDSAYYEKVLKMLPENKTATGTDLVNETSEEMLDRVVQNGEVFKGDTIEEIAAAIGAPPDVLKATVDRYNGMCANGVDTDFSKRDLWLSGTSLDTPPYYAAVVMARWFVTIFGLHCDEYSRVLNVDDAPIPNLFAAGNAQGDFFTDDYPLLTPGISHGRAAVFGRLIGKALAHDTLYDLPEGA